MQMTGPFFGLTLFLLRELIERKRLHQRTCRFVAELTINFNWLFSVRRLLVSATDREPETVLFLSIGWPINTSQPVRLTSERGSIRLWQSRSLENLCEACEKKLAFYH
jgi:hypothetical protein